MGRLKHGKIGTKLYRCWIDMRRRCRDKNNKYYGGAGISVFSSWDASYLNFEQWAKTSGYSDNLVLDRIDPKLGYNPDNCRWISGGENTRLCLEYHFQNKTGHFSSNAIKRRNESNRKVNGKRIKLHKDGLETTFETISDAAKYLSGISGKDFQTIRKNLSDGINNKRRKTCMGFYIEDAS